MSKILTDNGGGTGKVTFTGPGFGSGITINPTLTGVTTTTQSVDAYNAAIRYSERNVRGPSDR